MTDVDSRGISYMGAFFMLLAFAAAGLVFAGLLSIPVWQALTGLPFAEMPTAMLDPKFSPAMKVLQVLNALVGFLLPTVITAALVNRRPFKLLGFQGRISARQAALVLLLVPTALLISSSLSYLTHLIPITPVWQGKFNQMEIDYNKQITAILGLKNFGDYLLALGVMVFIPSLCEEVLFRGGLQNFLSRGTGKPWFSIVMSSIIFSLAHVSFYGFFSRLLLGIVLGAIYQYSGRLWLSVLAHFVNNGIALTALYIYMRQGKSMEAAMQDDPYQSWGLLALPVLAGLLFIFRRTSIRVIRDRRNFLHQ